VRFGDERDSETSKRKLTRTGRRAEQGFESPRSATLHLTKGSRPRSLEPSCPRRRSHPPSLRVALATWVAAMRQILTCAYSPSKPPNRGTGSREKLAAVSRMAEDAITMRQMLERIAASGASNRDLAGWAAKTMTDCPPLPRRAAGAKLVTLEACVMADTYAGTSIRSITQVLKPRVDGWREIPGAQTASMGCPARAYMHTSGLVVISAVEPVLDGQDKGPEYHASISRPVSPGGDFALDRMKPNGFGAVRSRLC
jgi:hypothetical protein